MNPFAIVSLFFTLNVLILVGFVVLKVLDGFLKVFRIRVQAACLLQLHYRTLLAVIVLSASQPFFPRTEIFKPVAKLWTSSDVHNDLNLPRNHENPSVLKVAPSIGGSEFKGAFLIRTLLVFFFLSVILRGLHWMRGLVIVQSIRRQSYRLRKVKSVSIYASEAALTPFSFWSPRHSDIFIPYRLTERPIEFKISVAHEIQHHRQGDTRWLHVLSLLKMICICNPILYFWNQWIDELQEFSCDEALVDHKKVPMQDYARCLLEVAENAFRQKNLSGCATGLVFQAKRKILTRRIEKMVKSKKESKTKLGKGYGLVIFALIGSVAFASAGMVQDRKVSQDQAQKWMNKAQQGSEFPIVLNSTVLKYLNRFLGTPEGRDFMRGALQRMELHRPEIESKMKIYNVPSELLALPITESGYRVLPEPGPESRNRSAGLWQFIPSTAKVFGLRMDSQKDERLNVALSTDAALRYLLSNKYRFKDWHLSILAYNMGERAVQNAIENTGSRNAWVLIERGYEGDKDYLAKFMASLIIMKNPELLD